MPPLPEVLGRVKHLEDLAARAFEGDPMDTTTKTIDGERIKELAGQGLSRKEIAAQLGIGRTSVAKYLRGGQAPNGQANQADIISLKHGNSPAQAAGPPASAKNGRASAPGELERFLDEQWRGFSLLERVQVLLRRGSLRA